MSHKPFVFVKGFTERFHELSNVLTNNVMATDIQKEWSNCMELAIEPIGWQAIWKMSRQLCIDLKINFPCTVIVVVEQVNFKELSCLVSIHEVEDDDIHLPEKMADVPLIELYPTMEQDNSSALSLYDTAQLIDNLRFFYNQLWMPWDLEFDEDVPWLESHLEGRLQLHFAMAERRVPHEISHTVRRLVAEGKQIQQAIEHHQEQLEGCGEVDGSGILLQLMELHNRIAHLRNKYLIYERPQLLEALIQRTEHQESSKSAVMLVMASTTPHQLTKQADLIAKATSDSQTIKVVTSLQEALVKVAMGGTVLLTAGEYPVRDLATLETGGSVIGLEPGVIITDDIESCSTLDLFKGFLSLTGLTLHMTTAWSIIKLRPNVECCLREITLVGATVTDGVDAFPGSRLSATGCRFTNCRTAITCDAGSTVALSNCTFCDNNIALEVTVGCKFSMNNCTISGSKMYGVHILMADKSHVSITSVSQINSIPEMKESGTICKDNAVDVRLAPVVQNHLSTQNGQTSVIS
ncbi:protein nessun dorma [Homalodisca vitripennis]|uniref:protein nessun dorma n=1 Tax=Homalodisca vitripennis TaxID=197043 RepID=UPI001EEC96C7|nr:protein nessun dorma [Homalodisca vitripennis]KAG8276517.1 SH2 domain binding [Homalodisca vitripennis]